MAFCPGRWDCTVIMIRMTSVPPALSSLKSHMARQIVTLVEPWLLLVHSCCGEEGSCCSQAKPVEGRDFLPYDCLPCDVIWCFGMTAARVQGGGMTAAGWYAVMQRVGINYSCNQQKTFRQPSARLRPFSSMSTLSLVCKASFSGYSFCNSQKRRVVFLYIINGVSG